MKWSYGVTTVPGRLDGLLPRTLHSLALAGFGEPRLFVDGEKFPETYEQRFDLEITVRYPQIHVYPNWILSMWELYLRVPDADRYALFQDDLVSVKNLRLYLEQSPYPNKSYLNLFTFLNNEAIVETTLQGTWHRAATIANNEHLQHGRGAVGLVFDHLAVITLLSSPHMAKRVQDTKRCKGGLPRGWTHADGGVVEAMNRAGYSEYVHSPSLLQHNGTESTTGSGGMPTAKTFPGEDFDAMEWLK